MNKFVVFLIASIVVKLFLSFATFHYDLQHFAMSGHFVSQGHILDLYDYIATLPDEDPLRSTNPEYPFNYPPLIYLFRGAWSFVIEPIMGLNLVNNFIISPFSQMGNIQTNLYLLLLKLPYLIFDIGLGILMMRFFPNARDKFRIWMLWLFNPISLYATYMVGQFDIIPTFLVILSLYFAVKNKMYLAAFLLGIGAAFKIYPLFLIVPLLFIEERWINRAKLLSVSLSGYILPILLYINSHGFKSTALVASQSTKSFYAQIPISGGEAIILFPAILISIYMIFFYHKTRAEDLWQRFFIILLLFFIFTHTHPQWLLWITPFYLLDLVKNNFKNWLPLGVSLLSYIGLLFFFDPSLTLGLFSPMWPELSNSQSLWQLLNISLDYNFSRSVLQTIFTGASLYYIYEYLWKKQQS